VLEKDFHADHIKPYSKRGLTTLKNGQAVCPKCNLSKGVNDE
jgi:5-methylcytosine-specific restriction endonuclease McrA